MNIRENKTEYFMDIGIYGTTKDLQSFNNYICSLNEEKISILSPCSLYKVADRSGVVSKDAIHDMENRWLCTGAVYDIILCGFNTRGYGSWEPYIAMFVNSTLQPDPKFFKKLFKTLGLESLRFDFVIVNQSKDVYQTNCPASLKGSELYYVEESEYVWCFYTKDDLLKLLQKRFKTTSNDFDSLLDKARSELENSYDWIHIRPAEFLDI